MSCGCDVRIINTGGGAGADIFVTGASIVGDDIVLTRNGAPDITIVGAATGGVDFTNLTAAEITALTQAIDFTQLTPAQVTELTQVIDFTQLSPAQVTAMTQAIDFNQLTPAQISALTQSVDFTQLTAQQTADLQDVIETMTTLELITVNAGTTAASGDGANGSEVLTLGDLLHFWSSDGSVNVNVTPGSAIVDITLDAINKLVDYTCYEDVSYAAPAAQDNTTAAGDGGFIPAATGIQLATGAATLTFDQIRITMQVPVGTENVSITVSGQTSNTVPVMGTGVYEFTFPSEVTVPSGSIDNVVFNGVTTAQYLRSATTTLADPVMTPTGPLIGFFQEQPATGRYNVFGYDDGTQEAYEDGTVNAFDISGGIPTTWRECETAAPVNVVIFSDDTIDGTGSVGDPLTVPVSADVNNALTVGTDGRLFAPAELPIESDDTIDGVGTVADPLTVTPSADADNQLQLGTDGQLFVPITGLPITQDDTTADANHTQEFANFGQTWNNMGTYDVNITQGNFDVSVANTFLPGVEGNLNVSLGSVVASASSSSPNGLDTEMRLASNVAELSATNNGFASFKIQNGSIGQALGVPQVHVMTQAIDAGSATAGQVLTLDGVSGEAEWRDVVATPTDAVFLPSNQIPQTDPTAANVQAWIAGNFLPGDEPAGQLIYYTGTAVAGDGTTHAFWVDGTGTVRQIEKPSGGPRIADMTCYQEDIGGGVLVKYNVYTDENGDQYAFQDGTTTEVDITGGIPGTWVEVPAIAAGATIDSIDLQATANPNEYTVVIAWTDADGNAQTTTDGTPVTINGGQNLFTDNLTLAADRVHALGTNDFRMNGDAGAEFGINIFDNAGFPPTGTSIFSTATDASLIFTGPGGGVVRVNNNGIDLSFGGTGDLEITGDPGTAGQVLSSNGPNQPPTWEDVSGEQWETVEFSNADYDVSTDYTGTKEYITLVNTGGTPQDITGLAGADVTLQNNEKINVSFFDGSWYAESAGAATGGDNLATSNLVQTDTNRTYDFGTTGAQSLNFIGQAAVGTAFNASADAVNLNGGTSSLSIGNDGIAMAMFGPTDLQINGNPGVASQVLTSNGPNTAPTWQAAGGSNLATANLTQTDPARTYSYGQFEQLSFSGGDFTVSANNTLNMISANSATLGTTTGPSVVVQNSPERISMQFSGGSLSIDNDAGDAGQVLTSNGVGAAPTWEDAGGSNLFDADDTLASGQTRNHTVDGSFGISGAGNFSVNMQGSNPFFVGFTADALINNVSMCASGSTGNNCVEATATGVQINSTDGLDFFIPGGLRLSGNTGIVGQQLTCQGAASPIWGAASDERVKESIADIKDAGIIVDNLRPVTFSYKQDGNKSAGFIAQEVEKILPNLVDKQKVEEIEDFRTLDYNGIFAIAVKALQDTRAEVLSLKARIEELEAK